jgi:hypothetical protein
LPAKPQGLFDIAAIVERLRALEVPVIDRSGCERIFGVRRRRAIELMHHFGGYQSGNTVLLDRLDLIRQLQELAASPAVEQERRRKERLSQKLDSLQRDCAAAAVRIPVVPVPHRGLPSGVEFASGRMTVSFSGVEELLDTLYALAQSAAGDFDAFRVAAESGNSPSHPAVPSS